MNSRQDRRLRYQNGTLERMTREKGADIWTYRWVERGSGKRRRVRLGTVKELRTMQAVKQAADGYRLGANRESDIVSQVTMAAVLDRYEREFVSPCATAPLGTVDDGESVLSQRRHIALTFADGFLRVGASTPSPNSPSHSCGRRWKPGWRTCPSLESWRPRLYAASVH